MLKVSLLILGLLKLANAGQYEPNWKSLDARPIPDWYDQSKIGIMMHFGVYSVPSFAIEGRASEWFWYYWNQNKDGKEGQYMKDNFRPDFTYQDFGRDLTMEFFDADLFAQIVADSGAKYFVFTSKHHEGFTNFKSAHTFGWNSVDIGPKRDVLQELKDAFEKTDVKFGLYHSLFEWFNPLYLSDKSNHYKTQVFPSTKMNPEFKYIVETYKPQLIWSDGEWEAPSSYWNSTELVAWLYNESPVKDTIVINDRWGSDCRFKHGGYWSGNDRYNPGTLQKHKWEDAFTLDRRSWGFRRDLNIADVLSPFEIMSTMARVISTGGNLLVNIGPSKEGTITAVFQERLSQMGSWLKVQGEAIYETHPWTYQNETMAENDITVWYTSRPDLNKVYAIVCGWPTNNLVTIKRPVTSEHTVVTMPCANEPLKFTQNKDSVTVELPDYTEIMSKCGKGGDWTYVVTFENLANN